MTDLRELHRKWLNDPDYRRQYEALVVELSDMAGPRARAPSHEPELERLPRIEVETRKTGTR